MNIENISQDSTLVNQGLVLRLEIEQIPILKRFCAEHEIRIIYQLTTIEHIRVVKEKDLLELSERAGP